MRPNVACDEKMSWPKFESYGLDLSQISGFGQLPGVRIIFFFQCCIQGDPKLAPPPLPGQDDKCSMKTRIAFSNTVYLNIILKFSGQYMRRFLEKRKKGHFQSILTLKCLLKLSKNRQVR